MRRYVALLSACLWIPGCNGSPTGPDGQPWSRSGTGNDVFDKPGGLDRVRITGRFTGSSSNFIIWCRPDLLVNELLGTSWAATSYSGTHAISRDCQQFEITNSAGVTWTITSVD